MAEKNPFAAYEPKGLRFFDKATGRDMLLVQEPGYALNGWLCFRHPDGQWVSHRKATPDDVKKLGPLIAASPSGGASTLSPCPWCGNAPRVHGFWKRTRFVIQCIPCALNGPGEWNTEGEAIAAWNRRAATNSTTSERNDLRSGGPSDAIK